MPTLEFRPLSPDEHDAVQAIYALHDFPPDLGIAWPRTANIAYRIGYLDAIMAAAELLRSHFAIRREERNA